jgi:hypothetical protein
MIYHVPIDRLTDHYFSNHYFSKFSKRGKLSGEVGSPRPLDSLPRRLAAIW